MTRRIGLIYDAHVSAGDRRESDGVDVTRAGIAKLNALDVDWTLLGGDIRAPALPDEEWGNWRGDPENYYYRADFERAKALFDEELDSEYFLIRGNCDRPLSVYREFFPTEEYPKWYWFEDDGARYVFLDTNPHEGYHALTDTQNFVTAPQLSMLERLMDEDDEIPTFVFSHAPLAKHTEIHDEWETTVRGNIATSAASYFWTQNYLSVQSVLERGNTVFVNSGHLYIDYGRGSRVVDGVEYVIGRHLTHPNDPDYSGDVRWLDVDTDRQTAAVRFYDVGEDTQGTITETSW